MGKRNTYILLCFSLLATILVAGCGRKDNRLVIKWLDPDTSIVLRNWYVIPEEEYNKVRLDSLSDSDYQLFRQLSKSDKSLYAHQDEDFLDVSKVLDSYASVSCYVYGYLRASEEGIVAFTTGIDNDAKIWINDSLHLAAHAGNITVHDFVFKANLRKGDNLIVVKISSDIDQMGFHLNVMSLKTANKYWYGRNFYSISKTYLVPPGDSLEVDPQNRCHDSGKPLSIKIFDLKGELLIDTSYEDGRSRKLDISSLGPGVFKCKLMTQELEYEHSFISGDYDSLIQGLIANFKDFAVRPEVGLNIATLVARFEYLTAFGKNNGFDQVLERKMSGIAYELARIRHAIREKKHPFKASPGYHIMSYKSRIDSSTNHYALYVPPNIDSLSGIPVVMVLPWVAKQHPFTESWHLAFIDRIEYLQHLAQKYQCAVMWLSARVYEQYNFNPIVNTAIEESFSDLSKYYQIDPNRIYAYGTCSGGTQTLLYALRHPSIFAAAGIEGPEISFLKSQKFPQEWVQENHIVAQAQNYGSLPLFIANSKNDWHGGENPEMADFTGALKRNGVRFQFESMEDPTVTNLVKMRDDNKITDRIFGFLIKQRRVVPDHIRFSTYQLKYNKSSWISIDRKITADLATVDAKLEGNKISLRTKNVGAFTIYPAELPGMGPKQLGIYVNNRYYQQINLDAARPGYHICLDTIQGTQCKTSGIEGPINHFFADRFILLNNANGVYAKAIETFTANWQFNFFGRPITRLEKDISCGELQYNNMLLLGINTSNADVKKMLAALPVTIERDTIKLFDKKWIGKKLMLKMVYPNPLNNDKYLLLLAGTNGFIHNPDITNLPLKGWFDYEITDSSSNIVYAGNFNQYWKLPQNLKN